MDENLLYEIKNKVSLKYGPDVVTEFIYNIDSIKIPYFGYPQPHKIYDEYNQLRNAIIFTSKKFDNGIAVKGLVGVYRNGKIIWDSDTTINFKDMDGLSLFSISDINRDGKTDLIFATDDYTESGNGWEKLYIYSWDGIKGKLITELNETGISTITSFTGFGQFDFVDVNGDGIFEIRGLWHFSKEDEKEKTVTYYWNGKDYSLNLSKPQPQENEFLTQNRIDITLHTKVEKCDSGFIYHYYLHNLSSSTQEVNSINFQLNIDSLTINYPPSYWYPVELNDLFGFEDLDWPTISLRNHFIKVDPSDSCGFKSYYLPAIVNLYVQGYNEAPSLIDTVDGNVVTFDDFYNNIFTNSNKSRTVGPSNLFDSLNVRGILDAIKDYCSQSFSLGWIKDSLTVYKYTNYFTSAKTLLKQNNISALKNILNDVLQEVEIDKEANLTSEAYALIKFNTEFLLGNIK